MENFRKLGLSEEIIRTLKDAGFKEPSEIQEKAIPLIVAGHDVIGGAATGSGKTLAFGAPILDKIHQNPSHGVQALIITPTRELSEQNCRSLKKFGTYLKTDITAVYGGVSYGPQIYALKKAEIVVGTPGRLLDHIKQGHFDLKNIRFLVLDEADRMLDMGFIEDITELINYCPKNRQTLLFSATISPDIKHIAQKYMRNPQEVDAASHVDASKLKQIFYDVPPDMKFSLLVHLLKHEKQELVMVFCNTRRNADFISKNLKRYDISARAIHGGLSQNKRNSTMDMFHAKDVRVLVCTDVAARGLDIKGVSHVYNYDIPKTSKEYVHRIGRTARAGKEGIAVNILTRNDYMNFREVMRDESLNIEMAEVPSNVEKVSISFKDTSNRRESSRNFGRGEESRRENNFGRRSFGRNNSRDNERDESSGRRFRPHGRRFSSGGRDRLKNRFSHRDSGRRFNRGSRQSYNRRR